MELDHELSDPKERRALQPGPLVAFDVELDEGVFAVADPAGEAGHRSARERVPLVRVSLCSHGVVGGAVKRRPIVQHVALEAVVTIDAAGQKAVRFTHVKEKVSTIVRSPHARARPVGLVHPQRVGDVPHHTAPDGIGRRETAVDPYTVSPPDGKNSSQAFSHPGKFGSTSSPQRYPPGFTRDSHAARSAATGA